MDLNEVSLMAQMAMENCDFPRALHFLSMGLAHLAEVASPIASVSLLVQRAECFWQVGEFQASVTDMEQAIRAGLPRKFNNSQVILRMLISYWKDNIKPLYAHWLHYNVFRAIINIIIVDDIIQFVMQSNVVTLYQRFCARYYVPGLGLNSALIV